MLPNSAMARQIINNLKQRQIKIKKSQHFFLSKSEFIFKISYYLQKNEKVPLITCKKKLEISKKLTF